MFFLFLKKMFFIFVVAILILPFSVLADTDADADKSIDTVGNLKNTGDVIGFINASNDEGQITFILADIIYYLLGFIGIAFFCLTFYGGYIWLSAFGNDEKVSEAKNIIIPAVVGMLVIFSSYVVVSFVVDNFIKTATTYQ